MLFFLFSVGMGRNIRKSDFLFDVFLLLIDKQKALFKDSHLSQPHQSEVLLLCEIPLEEISQMVLRKLIQQGHKERFQIIGQTINCFCSEGQNCLVSGIVDLSKWVQG